MAVVCGTSICSVYLLTCYCSGIQRMFVYLPENRLIYPLMQGKPAYRVPRYLQSACSLITRHMVKELQLSAQPQWDLLHPWL